MLPKPVLEIWHALRRSHERRLGKMDKLGTGVHDDHRPVGVVRFVRRRGWREHLGGDQGGNRLWRRWSGHFKQGRKVSGRWKQRERRARTDVTRHGSRV